MESAGGAPKAVHSQELLELFNGTVRFWRGWLLIGQADLRDLNWSMCTRV
jgi:hypothetical protein